LSSFAGITRAIDSVQGSFELGTQEGRFEIGGRRRFKRHATGAASEDGGQFVKFDEVVETGAAGVLLELASGFRGGSEHILVEQPFLETEAFDAFFPI
jgi:hypothetical protein